MCHCQRDHEAVRLGNMRNDQLRMYEMCHTWELSSSVELTENTLHVLPIVM